MTLFIEIAAGGEPVIYRSKKRRYLVPKKYLLKCYAFACKAHALQRLKNHSAQYDHAARMEQALREEPAIRQVYHVEARKWRKRIKGWIESFAPDSDKQQEITEEGEYDDDDRQ